MMDNGDTSNSKPRVLGSINANEIKVLSFDLDDTIWACAPVLHRAGLAQTAFIKEHFPHVFQCIPNQDFAQFQEQVKSSTPHVAHDYTLLRKYSLRQLAGMSGLHHEDHHDDFVERTFEVFLSERSNVLDHVYDGVLEMIARLRVERGLQVVAITNGNAKLASIGNLLSETYFEHHINPSTVGAAKPDPGPFMEMLRLTGASPHQVIHIGDSMRSDIEPANKLGMKTVWIVGDDPDRWKSVTSGEYVNVADAILAKTSDLEKVLVWDKPVVQDTE